MRVLAVFGILIFSLSTFSAERAKWGMSGYGTLFWKCTQGFCTGNDNDVYQSIYQSFPSNLVLNCEASFGSCEWMWRCDARGTSCCRGSLDMLGPLDRTIIGTKVPRS